MLSRHLSGTIYTDFERERILACRNLIRKYIQNFKFCDSGLIELEDELEEHIPALPTAIAERIETYIGSTMEPLERRLNNALSNAGEEVGGRITFASADEFFAITVPIIEDALAELDSMFLPLLSA